MSDTFENYSFTVDAELLRELGERLVGKPHIALAELIKNSYDADATHVEIWYTGDEIEVVDDGHGMSRRDFLRRWMRLGTTQKRVDRYSPVLNRPLTGSKGVGRLAVQLLAHETIIRSQVVGAGSGIEARVDWRTIQGTRDLESVEVGVRDVVPGATFAENSPHGFSVRLRHLTDEWDAASFADVAQEVWALRPPFVANDANGMFVSLYTDDTKIETSFDAQMSAILDIWNGRVSGSLMPTGMRPESYDGTIESRFPEAVDEDERQLIEEMRGARLAAAGDLLDERFIVFQVELRGKEAQNFTFRIPSALVDEFEFEVRAFNLQSRQPRGIRVADARDYLRKFGGVGIYDTGFRLPYYGADQDWLDIGRDQARRLSRSELLPAELRVDRGLLDLPSNSRLFGWVQVSTGHEEAAWEARELPKRHALSIQVTRDRLVNNNAYQQLRTVVRTALDLYAMEVARDKARSIADRSKKSSVRSSQVLGSLSSVVNETKEFLPQPLFKELHTAVTNATRLTRESEEDSQQYASLLGALATAGSTSLAYEHEISKQVGTIRSVAEQVDSVLPRIPGPEADVIRSVSEQLKNWVERATGIRAVFGSLLSKESRERVEVYNARKVLRKVVRDLQPLAKGIPVDISGVSTDILLPPAALPAWTSVFQNLVINSYNALQESPQPGIWITAARLGGEVRLTVADNGIGVDLATASELWRPFERKLKLDPAREAAGLGGLGLGLTIVRMICDQVGVSVRFTRPGPGRTTAVALQWTEPEL